ncbi:hypothetical protein BOTBODRAFT_54954 [Botryobasidium botryosum FD-172 SS1]|uniref:Transcription initiation factor TFIID subunit 4 n=1 Tax=Botryobasidium botryosum (strain FD-172 SS1) TaxID=930990 RepID=A0A067MHS8_BOTB1|nr:hypothetical protein BOTBODRAFT_54954 [Botryobasidium botryosum FD-172 SS1]
MPQHHPPPAQVPRPQQQQQPQQQHPQQQQTQHHPPPQQAVQQTPAPPQSQLDTADVATLRDALGSAGIDIRAEEEAIHRGQDMGQSQYMGAREDRSHKQTVIDSRLMGQVVRGIATKHNVTKVSEDSVNYLALALRARLQSIIGSALSATSHRTASQFSRPPGLYPDGSPMWTEVVRRDVGKQLTVLEKVEREDEQRARRERREKMEAGDSAGVSGVNGGPEVGGIAGDAGALGVDEDGKKRKKKTDGPGVTARNMSEDVRKKMSDAVATRAAGLGANKYAWMTAGASASPAAKKPNPPAAAAGSSAPSTTPTPLPRAAAPPPAGSGWARAYVAPKQATAEDDSKTVTLRDLMFVVQRERGHGGGRGSAKGWT